MRMLVLNLLAMVILSPPAASQDCIDYGDYLHWAGMVDTPDNAYDVFVAGNYAYVADRDSGLQVVDITDPASPRIVGDVKTPYRARAVAVADGYAYVTDVDAGLLVIDITLPANPVVVGNVETLGEAEDVVVEGYHAYVSDGSSGIQIIDVSDPENPVIVGSVDTPDRTRQVVVMGGYAYVADRYSGLQIIDVAAPHDPVIVGSVDTPEYVRSVAVSGSYAYLTDMSFFDGSHLRVVDITDPHAPQIVGDWFTTQRIHSVVADGNHLFITEGARNQGLTVLDISNPTDPVLVGRVGTLFDPLRLVVSGGIAYVACGRMGLQVIDVTNAESPRPFRDFREHSGLDRADKIAADDLVAWVTVGNGMYGFDVADPGNPSIVAAISGALSDVAVRGGYAYLIAYPGPVLQVVELLRPFPVVVGRVTLPGDQGFAESLTLAGEYVFVAKATDGIQIVNVENPENPELAGQVDTPGIAVDISVSGNYAYVADRVNGLQVVDISNVENPIIVGNVDPPFDSFWGVSVRGSHAFVAASDNLQVIDVSEPDAPLTVGALGLPGTPSTIMVTGDIAYVSTRQAGLQVIDVSNPEHPVIIGSMDALDQTRDLAVVGDYVYLVHEEGFLIAPTQCQNVDVVIDIKPGNAQNPVNCKGNPGVIPVAVLTTDTFDALSIDHTTVRFGPGEAAEFHVYKGREPRSNGASSSRPIPGAAKRHEKDVDHDGDLDLLFHFARDETGIRCGDTEAVLTGQTYDGQSIVGTDAIRTVPDGDTEPEPGGQLQISPNPFNPSTSISFVLKGPQQVKIGVYDVRGRLVAELANEPYPAGRYAVEWQGRDTAGRSVPSGTYFFRVDLGGQVAVRKALLMK